VLIDVVERFVMLYKVVIEKENLLRNLIVRDLCKNYQMSNNDIWKFVRIVKKYQTFIEIKTLIACCANYFNVLTVESTFVDCDQSKVAVAEWNLIAAREELEKYERELLRNS